MVNGSQQLHFTTNLGGADSMIFNQRCAHRAITNGEKVYVIGGHSTK